MMKKIYVLLLVMMTLPMFAAEADLKKAKGLVHNMQRKLTSFNSMLKEKEYTVYRKRVALELALKRIDKEFAKVHVIYSEKRAIHIKDPKNTNKKEVYHSELGKMIDLLLKKAINNKNVDKPLQIYLKQVLSFRKDISKELKKNERKKYAEACAAVDKGYGIK